MSKSRKHRSYWSLIIILPLLTLVAFLLYEKYFPPVILPVGTWTRTTDMTYETDEAIRSWLSDAAYGLDYTYPEDGEPVTLTIVLTVDPEGNYEQHLDPDSYEPAYAAAYANMESALKSLINLRFAAIGMTDEDGISDEEAEALMQDAVGMGTAEYLKMVAPDIMPSCDELAASFEQKGIYEESWLFDENRLVIDDVVYVRADDER